MQFWSEIILVISNRTRAARSFDFEITRWTLFFQDILTNPIISQISFFMTSSLRYSITIINESVELNISKTFSKLVFIFLFFFRLFLYARSVGNLSTSTRWIWEELHYCIFTFLFVVFFWCISRWPRILNRLIALAYPSQN